MIDYYQATIELVNQWLDSIDSLGDDFIPIDFVTPTAASQEEEEAEKSTQGEDISEL